MAAGRTAIGGDLSRAKLDPQIGGGIRLDRPGLRRELFSTVLRSDPSRIAFVREANWSSWRTEHDCRIDGIAASKARARGLRTVQLSGTSPGIPATARGRLARNARAAHSARHLSNRGCPCLSLGTGSALSNRVPSSMNFKRSQGRFRHVRGRMTPTLGSCDDGQFT
jgi:hypothetical protein